MAQAKHIGEVAIRKVAASERTSRGLELDEHVVWLHVQMQSSHLVHVLLIIAR